MKPGIVVTEGDGSQPQSHMTFEHVSIYSSTRPNINKLCRVIIKDDGLLPIRFYDLSRSSS